MTEILIAVASLVSIGGSAFFNWFFIKRKTDAETRTTEIENDIKLSNYYKELMDDLKQRYESKYNEFAQMLDSQKQLLKEEIAMLKKQVEALKAENNELRKKLEGFK